MLHGAQGSLPASEANLHSLVPSEVWLRRDPSGGTATNSTSDASNSSNLTGTRRPHARGNSSGTDQERVESSLAVMTRHHANVLNWFDVPVLSFFITPLPPAPPTHTHSGWLVAGKSQTKGRIPRILSASLGTSRMT